MINTQELRIGNYVFYKDQAILLKGVKENTVFLDGVLVETYNLNQPYDYKPISADDACLRPIPLCDAILQKIRLRMPIEGGYCYTYYKNYPSFLIYMNNNNGYYIGLNYQGEVCRVTPGPLYYLHQLQNIYYAQYGIEMDVSEKILKQSVQNAIVAGVI